MNTTIVSRDRIAALADDAARRWAAAPDSPKPACPFDAELEPDHFEAWNECFECALLLHSAVETQQ